MAPDLAIPDVVTGAAEWRPHGGGQFPRAVVGARGLRDSFSGRGR